MNNDREPFDQSALDALLQPTTAPDQTVRVMARLGYMRSVARVARRRRLQRWARRSFAVCSLVVIVGVAARMHQLRFESSLPAGPTIPAAVGSDVEAHRARFEQAIQMIRTIAPAPSQASPEPETTPPTDTPAPEIDECIDRSAVGPVRWL